MSLLCADRIFDSSGRKTILDGLGDSGGNSLIICVIGLKTGQLGFIPANLFCIVLYVVNLRTWRKAEFSCAARLDNSLS